MTHRVACYILQSLVDTCKLVECTNRFVYVQVVGVRFGGVYEKCSERVHGMQSWL